MKIPIIKAGQDLPEHGPAYIIGKHGFYMRKDSTLYESIVRIDSIPDFEPVSESIV